MSSPNTNFADRLIEAILAKGTPCVVGLDPRVDLFPTFITDPFTRSDPETAIYGSIAAYHRFVIDLVAARVPAVKLQIAFYEQYGVAGLTAFAETVRIARAAGLVVIVDAKRGDIGPTDEAYARAFLGRSEVFGTQMPIFDVDCITVAPYLGRDSLEPFVRACKDWGKGIFVLVRTSNPSAGDFQDLITASGRPVYEEVGVLVEEIGRDLIGRHGYSSIGAVVGAPYPHEAHRLRLRMPHTPFLVPGYGAQGASADDATAAFDANGLGAIINASRSITYAHETRDTSSEDLSDIITSRLETMVNSVTRAIRAQRHSTR